MKTIVDSGLRQCRQICHIVYLHCPGQVIWSKLHLLLWARGYHNNEALGLGEDIFVFGVISHFIASVCHFSTISHNHRHLLLLDGHCSHVTLEVMHEAKDVGLDLVTLPSYTLIARNVAFGQEFVWTFQHHFKTTWNMNQLVSKETLAHWFVSLWGKPYDFNPIWLCLHNIWAWLFPKGFQGLK